MSVPRVSVLVPCWNDGRFLDEALRSVAAQSFGDFEAIVADDGSTDDTPAIGAAWAARDPRFRLARSETNLGMGENWNRALGEARGELVAKLDGDDAWGEETLGRMVAEFAATSDLLLAGVRTVNCDEALVPVRTWPGEEALVRAGLDPARRHQRPGLFWWHLSLADFQLWSSCATLVPRRELERLGGWDARWLAADTDLLLRLLELDRPVVHLPYEGIRYRRRAGSASRTAAAEGWKPLEVMLITLGSLARRGTGRGLLSARVRWNWWRLDAGVERLLAVGALARAPERYRTHLADAAATRAPRPAAVRIEGALRGRFGSLRHRARAERSREP